MTGIFTVQDIMHVGIIAACTGRYVPVSGKKGGGREMNP
jgi:hypothetical protein